MSTPLPAVKILRHMDALYDRALDEPDNDELRGELRAYTQSLAWIMGMTYEEARAYVIERHDRHAEGRNAPRLDTWGPHRVRPEGGSVPAQVRRTVGVTVSASRR